MLVSPTQTPDTSGSPKIVRGHSCVLCQQRKVKCDRQKPCSNCVKARAECVPSVPTVPRRRRRKFSEQDLAARLRRCENLLRKHGISLDDDESTDATFVAKRYRDWCGSGAPNGMMLADSDHSRYVERYGLLLASANIVLTAVAHYGRISETRLPRTQKRHLEDPLTKTLKSTRSILMLRLSSLITTLLPKISAPFIHLQCKFSGSGRRISRIAIP